MGPSQHRRPDPEMGAVVKDLLVRRQAIVTAGVALPEVLQCRQPRLVGDQAVEKGVGGRSL
jgi:hypothetical protein